MPRDLSISDLLDEYELTDILRSLRLRRINLDSDNSEETKLYQDVEESLGKFTRQASKLIDLDKEKKAEKSEDDVEKEELADKPYYEVSKRQYRLRPEKTVKIGDVYTVIDKNGLASKISNYAVETFFTPNRYAVVPPNMVRHINELFSSVQNNIVSRNDFAYFLAQRMQFRL